jgi:2,5-diketo-D-gluconate reductase B
VPRDPARVRSLTVQGVEIPKLGLGTWQITGADATEAVRDALELGYRHIDTAVAYGNHVVVGRGLAASPVDRDDVVLTTKLWYEDLDAAGVQRQIEDALRDLATDRVDLLLVHWPSADVPIAETLGAMLAAQDAGRVRHLGVSNFPTRHLLEALEHAPLVTDQVEFHAYLGQPELLALCRERDVALTAYSPFAHGGLLDDPVLARIGEAHGKSAGQVALRWLLDQPNVGAVPKAASHANRAANLDVFDFELTDEQRGAIAGLQRGERTIDPGFAPDWD